jgi:uncharacterized repeat protein (TIGR01451 family)
VLFLVFGAGVTASAAGSRNLWPSGAAGNRANTEWRTSSYGGGKLARRTLIKAYLSSSEVLLLGSTAIGQGSGDILVYNPGLVTGPVGTETVPPPAAASFSCNAQRVAAGAPPGQGRITSRAQELAGPDTIPASIAGAYVPCHYQAPAAGIYDVAFLGPSGFAPTPDLNASVGADVALDGVAHPEDYSAAQGNSIAAWDATVRSSLTSSANLNGRVFTYYLGLFTAGNGRPVYPTVYALTRDGYRYQIDLRGMDPNGWLLYGNQVGFYDSDGATPLYHDAVADATGSPGQLTGIQGGVSIAVPSFPLFFEPPAAAVVAALGIPATPVAPTISSVSFAGNQGGNVSLVNTGGTFTYTSNVSGVYQFVISRDGVNFDPTLPVNRSLRGVRPAGTQSVSWDGLDNSGTAFPVGTYQVRASIHAGEYHFPMLDVENDTQGGPIITLLNPPGGTCPALIGGCKGAIYDDRAYRTLNGTVVNQGNTVGSVLCGANAPATPAADPINGFDSSSTQRAFGAASGGNTNVPCTGNFGDTKGLDIWTYYPSNSPSTSVVLVSAAADIAVGKSVSDATPAIGTNITFTITTSNRGPNDATGITVSDPLPAGLTFVSASASQGSHSATTGTWSVGSLANGASASLQLTATVTGTSAVTNTATRSGSSPGDYDPANDTASAQVTGSTVPGLPNNGVPPIGKALFVLGPVLVLAIVLGGLRRRRTRPGAATAAATPARS